MQPHDIVRYATRSATKTYYSLFSVYMVAKLQQIFNHTIHLSIFLKIIFSIISWMAQLKSKKRDHFFQKRFYPIYIITERLRADIPMQPASSRQSHYARNPLDHQPNL